MKKPKIAYDFLKAQIRSNKAFKHLSSEDIDFIIYNQLKLIAERRGWVKNVPVSIFYHK